MLRRSPQRRGSRPCRGGLEGRHPRTCAKRSGNGLLSRHSPWLLRKSADVSSLQSFGLTRPLPTICPAKMRSMAPERSSKPKSSTSASVPSEAPVAAQAVPDFRLLRQRQFHRIDAEQVDVAKDERQHGSCELRRCHEPAGGEARAIAQGLDGVEEDVAADSVHHAAPGLAQEGAVAAGRGIFAGEDRVGANALEELVPVPPCQSRHEPRSRDGRAT